MIVKKTIENKTGGFIGFLSTALFFLLNYKATIYITGINAIHSSTILCYNKIVLIMNMILFSLPIITLIITLYHFGQVLGKPRQYKRIELKDTINIFLDTIEPKLFYLKLAAIYTKEISHNRTETDKKISSFYKGIQFLRWSIVLLVTWFIFFHLSGTSYI